MKAIFKLPLSKAEKEMENDLKQVDNIIREYYGLEK